MNHAIEAQYPFKCTTPIQLRFNDVDALGHVNNSVYFQFFDLGKTQYFKGLNVQTDIDWRRPTVIIANVNCSFLTPTLFNERVEVLTQCAKLGNKSLTLLQHLVNRDTTLQRLPHLARRDEIDDVTNSQYQYTKNDK